MYPINRDFSGPAERVRLINCRLIGNYPTKEYHHFYQISTVSCSAVFSKPLSVDTGTGGRYCHWRAQSKSGGWVWRNPFRAACIRSRQFVGTSSCLGSILFTLIFTCMWVAHTSFRRTKYIFECVFLRIIISDKTWCKMLSPKFIRLINMVIIVILGITSCTSYLTSVPFLPKPYNL